MGAGRTTERIKILNGKIISFQVCGCFNVLLSTQREACNGFPPEIEYYILRSLTIETLWAFLSDRMVETGDRRESPHQTGGVVLNTEVRLGNLHDHHPGILTSCAL